MPLYEYHCDACDSTFEKIQQKYSDAQVEVCPKCGKGPVRKLISSPAIQFKGTGWYVTDYAKKSSTDGGSSSGKSGSDKSEKSDSGKSDSPAASDSSSSSTDSSAAKPTTTKNE
jgi:putative FmdB family regulatory protein